MEFVHLNALLQENFKSLSENASHMFEVELDKEELWALYLDSFPPGTNKMFRERREFDCGCCRHFIKTIGNAVFIINNKVYTIWDFETGDDTYQPVLNALSAHVKSKAVSDVWFYISEKVGTLKNYEPLESGEVLEWDHFHLTIPTRFVNNVDVSGKSIASLQGALRDSRNVFKRSLDELTEDSILTVLELISQNSLYKGEEWKGVLTEFLKHKKAYASLQTEEEKVNYTWEQSVKTSGAICKIRNTSMGELLINISEGMFLDNAVREYEKIVAPENYKRVKTIYSEKQRQEMKKYAEDNGLMPSFPRRHATLDDITVNNILFSNKDAAARMEGGDIFEEMRQEVAVDPKKFSKIEEISIENFIKNVAPTLKSLEVLLENKQANNLVSLIAPEHKDSKMLFKWNNHFSWAYAGNITDSSMKQNVKSAGGNVDGVLRFSIQWNDNKYDGNDLDAHCKEPDGYEIYYPNKRKLSPTGGVLDVDIVNPDEGVPAVENITWADKSKMKKGTYTFFVENFTNRGGRDGFKAEIEFDGVIHSFEYNREVRNKEQVVVAEVYFDGHNFTIKEKLPSSVSSRELWNLKTNQFVPVSVFMFSPNYWDEQQGIGHKHYFFMLKDCVNPEQPNGFYNEFLKEEFMQHRHMFDALGSKMAVRTVEDQLSGLGFSSTKRNDVVVKATSQYERLLKIKF